MTIVDLIKDLIDSSKERLKTPISGAFVWAFIIYNWRPIVELIFSNVSIEDRIYIIDQEYCNIWAILTPAIIALIYTIGVPYLMTIIDSILVYTKKERLNKIYIAKGDEVDLKINLASKILDLKNAESGNKEIQDFLDQIEDLKNINSQMAAANKNNIEQLTKKLEESNNLNSEIRSKYEKLNDILKNVVREESNGFEKQNKVNGLLTIIENFTPREFESIQSIDFSGKELDLSKQSANLITKLYELGFIEKENDNIKLTELGKMLRFYIETNKK